MMGRTPKRYRSQMEPVKEEPEEDCTSADSHVLSSSGQLSDFSNAVMDTLNSSTNATCHQIEEELSMPQLGLRKDYDYYEEIEINELQLCQQQSLTKVNEPLKYNPKPKGLHFPTEFKKALVNGVNEILCKEFQGQQLSYAAPKRNSRELHAWTYDDYIPTPAKYRLLSREEHVQSEICSRLRDKQIQVYFPSSNKTYKHKSVNTRLTSLHTKDGQTSTLHDHCLDTRDSFGTSSLFLDFTKDQAVPPREMLSKLSVFSNRLKMAGSDLNELLTNLKGLPSSHQNSIIKYVENPPEESRKIWEHTCKQYGHFSNGRMNKIRPPFRATNRPSRRNYCGARYNSGRLPTRDITVSTGSLGASEVYQHNYPQPTVYPIPYSGYRPTRDL